MRIFDRIWPRSPSPFPNPRSPLLGEGLWRQGRWHRPHCPCCTNRWYISRRHAFRQTYVVHLSPPLPPPRQLLLMSAAPWLIHPATIAQPPSTSLPAPFHLDLLFLLLFPFPSHFTCFGVLPVPRPARVLPTCIGAFAFKHVRMPTKPPAAHGTI